MTLKIYTLSIACLVVFASLIFLSHTNADDGSNTTTGKPKSHHHHHHRHSSHHKDSVTSTMAPKGSTPGPDVEVGSGSNDTLHSAQKDDSDTTTTSKPGMIDSISTMASKVLGGASTSKDQTTTSEPGGDNDYDYEIANSRSDLPQTPTTTTTPTPTPTTAPTLTPTPAPGLKKKSHQTTKKITDIKAPADSKGQKKKDQAPKTTPKAKSEPGISTTKKSEQISAAPIAKQEDPYDTEYDEEEPSSTTSSPTDDYDDQEFPIK